MLDRFCGAINALNQAGPYDVSPSHKAINLQHFESHTARQNDPPSEREKWHIAQSRKPGFDCGERLMRVWTICYIPTHSRGSKPSPDIGERRSVLTSHIKSNHIVFIRYLYKRIEIVAEGGFCTPEPILRSEVQDGRSELPRVVHIENRSE